MLILKFLVKITIIKLTKKLSSKESKNNSLGLKINKSIPQSDKVSS